MLSKEEAQAIIDAHMLHESEVRARQDAAIALLPETLRPLADALLDYGYRSELEAFDETTPEDRQRIWLALVPRLAPYMEIAWAFQKTKRPYNHRYGKKAFRAPQHPAASLDTRIDWVRQLIECTAVFDEDLLWMAQFAGYMRRYSWAQDSLGDLFAAIIDSDDPLADELFALLLASARGEHEIGKLGYHIPRALLGTSHPEGWQLMSEQLMATRRDNALREAILRIIDEAHPDAFAYMLRIIVEHDLVRWDETRQEATAWFSFSEEVELTATHLQTALELIDNPATRDNALKTGDGQSVYFALWALAQRDAFIAIPRAAALLRDADLERRFAALYLLTRLDLPEANAAMLPALSDEDFRPVAYVCSHLRQRELPENDQLFEMFETAFTRYPGDSETLPPLVWEWQVVVAHRSDAATLMLKTLGERSPRRLLPYLDRFENYLYNKAVREIARLGWDEPDAKALVLEMVADRKQDRQTAALGILREHGINADIAVALEDLLTRKSQDLRTGVLIVLAKQDDADALASAERLLAAKKAPQRAAGAELLYTLFEAGRAVAACQDHARQYRDVKLDETSAGLLERILDEASVLSLDDALGLMNPAERTTPVSPRDMGAEIFSSAALACLHGLDDFIGEQNDAPVIGADGRSFYIGYWPDGIPFPHLAEDVSIEEQAARLPFLSPFREWADNRPDDLRDGDGFTLLRALFAVPPDFDYTTTPDGETLMVSFGRTAYQLLLWLVGLTPTPGGADFALDALETALARIPAEEVARAVDAKQYDTWRHNSKLYYRSLIACVRWYSRFGADWDTAHDARLFRLLRWVDEPLPEARRLRPNLNEVLRAQGAGAASQADLYDQLIGPDNRNMYGVYFPDFHYLSARRPLPELEQYPVLQEIFTACRRRVLEVELARGDLPTAATQPALTLRAMVGTDWFVRLLEVFDTADIQRVKPDLSDETRARVFSHLLSISYPAADETPEMVAEMLRSIPTEALIAAAVYAPQWADHVEMALGWDGLASGIWWLYAHTKDTYDEDMQAVWEGNISSRTPLSGKMLLDGAVDVNWFHRVHRELGETHWDALAEAAKYASDSGGHARAKLFADALRGRLQVDELVARIVDKRHQDSLRALGLLPLTEDDPETDIIRRYAIIQDFIHTGHKVGPQRRESEAIAAQIALENLARTAGYAQPLRLIWRMEARTIDDLGELSATVDDVTVTFAFDNDGQPRLTITREGKPLKAIPAKLRKAEPFIAIVEQQKRFIEQQKRLRYTLETAMQREDYLMAEEVAMLLAHPATAPIIAGLIFISDGLMGYPVAGALRGHDGTQQSWTEDTQLRVAHPYDLHQSGEWDAWQRECFTSQRVQPFKQVFRELYLLTEVEQSHTTRSIRYAGQQVKPVQAVGILGERGWTIQPDEGLQRTYHDRGIAALLTFEENFFAPSDVRILTVKHVEFSPVSPWNPMPLTDVPPVIFSEVMRDIDLMVSVAFREGVPPHTSLSIIDMRAALVEGTAAMFKLNNVRVEQPHVIIDGQRHSYKVHLGSGVVYRSPANALCIISVQNAEPVFLPFADDDPRAAEIIARVLLLAHDHQITDLGILVQL